MLKPGAIVFCWPTNFGALLTMIGQGPVQNPKPPTHVCMVGENGTTLHTTLAKGWSYGEVDTAKYLKKMPYEVYRLTSLTPLQQSKIMTMSRSRFGGIYPLWDLVTMTVGIWKKRDKPNKLWYCSKAVATCYWAAYYSLWGRRPVLSDITPEMLYENVTASSLFARVGGTDALQ